MREITSLQNALIKEVSKLQIKKYRKDFILIEGKKSVEEAILAGLDIKQIFTSCEKMYELYGKYETYFVQEPVMKKISTTESAPEIVAVVKKPVYDVSDFLKFRKIVLLDSIKDAGNLGTVIRAASAFGMDGILLVGDCVDEFSPKTIRSAAGNMFKIPILKTDIANLKAFKKSHKFIATVVKSDSYLNDFKADSNFIVMFGSEADGLCNELLKISDMNLTIKMKNNVESLNLGLSCGIVLYMLQFA